MTRKNKTLIIILAVIVVSVAVLLIVYLQERKDREKEQPIQFYDAAGNPIKYDPNGFYPTGDLINEDDWEPAVPLWLSWSEGTGMTLDDIMHMMSELAGVSDKEILRRINTWERAHIGDGNSSCPLQKWARAAGVDMYDLIHMMSESTGVSENVIIEYLYLK